MNTTSPVTVRFTRREDVPGACGIVNHYIDRTTSNFRTEPYTEAEWAAQWEGHRDRYPWLVAESEGEVAGLAYAVPWNAREAYSWTAESTVYVADGHRGKRVGSLLYAELFERLERQGFHSVMAQVTRPNPGSDALHTAFGFEQVGVIRDAGYKLGKWLDVGIWQLKLATPTDPPAPTAPVEP